MLPYSAPLHASSNLRADPPDLGERAARKTCAVTESKAQNALPQERKIPCCLSSPQASAASFEANGTNGRRLRATLSTAVSSLRMHATNATFGRFPAPRSR